MYESVLAVATHHCPCFFFLMTCPVLEFLLTITYEIFFVVCGNCFVIVIAIRRHPLIVLTSTAIVYR